VGVRSLAGNPARLGRIAADHEPEAAPAGRPLVFEGRWLSCS
jgi:hypothetical protein